MGVQNELDLLMGETLEKQDMAKTKKDKGLIDYTQDLGEVKKEKTREVSYNPRLAISPIFYSD